MKKRFRTALSHHRLAHCLIFGGSIGLAGFAHAQQIGAIVDESALDEIVVTGSRIARAVEETPAPLSVLSESFLQQNTGAIDLGRALALEPSMGFSGTMEASQNSGAGATRGADTGGFSRADLRRLGSNRTLVLVNGRRRVAGAVDTAAADLNAIMPAMVERVEIITGGASAVYGSDAVSGVVNFVLKKGFDGLELSGHASQPVQGDFGSTANGTLIFGSGFDGGRGNVSVGVSHVRRDAVVPSDVKNMRDWGAVLNPAYAGPTGSIPQRLITPETQREWGAYGAIGYANDTGTVGRVRFDVNGKPEPLPTRLGVVDANFAYFGPNGCGEYCFRLTDFITVSPEQNRSNAFASFFYELGDSSELYGDLTYADAFSRGRGQSNQVDGADAHVINVRDNPYLDANLRSALLAQGRTSVRMSKGHDEVGRLFSEVDRRTITATAGLRGSIETQVSDITYDAFYGFGQSQIDFTLLNRMLVANTAAAIDAVRDPTDGVIKCRMDVPSLQPAGYIRPTIIGNLPCSPFNIFGPFRSSEAARDFVRATVYRSQTVEQKQAGFSFRGDSSKWLTLPGGGSFSLAVGVEHRDETAETKNDGLLKGPFIIRPERAVDLTAGFDVSETFAEISVPLLRDLPWARVLTVDGAVRQAKYSHAGTVEAWKAGLYWQPAQDISIRGTIGTAVRAPNIVEAFRPDETSSAGVQDPCSQENVNLNPFRVANCAALGRPAGWVNPLGGRTLPLRVSGNVGLEVETSDSWTAGITLNPRFLDGLEISFDWYNIEIADAIVLVSAANTVTNCVDNPGGPDPRFCSFVERDLSAGSPFFFALNAIRSTYLNASKLETSGYDVKLRYAFSALRGDFDLALVGTHLKKLRQFPFQTNPNVFIEEAGYTNAPEKTGIFSARYSRGPWEFTWQSRFQSSADTTSTLGRNPILLDVNQTGSIVYHDAAIKYDFAAAERSFNGSVYLGVQNIFDESLPILRVQEWFNSGGAYETNGPTAYLGFRWKL